MTFLSKFLLAIVCVASFFNSTSGQAGSPSPTPSPTPTTKSRENSRTPLKNLTVEQLIETSIFVYGLGGGREKLSQIRKTTIERGTTKVPSPSGGMQDVKYQKYTVRGETTTKDKVRIDQDLATARYSLLYADDSVIGILDNNAFPPTSEATEAFKNQIFYNLDAFLRYKENGTKLALIGKDKIGGVEFHKIELTETSGRKMLAYLSAKSFRVMMLDYEHDGIKYRRKFYDYNDAQGTLVPFKTVLYSGDNVVEETEVGTVTYGQTVDSSIFSLPQQSDD